MTEREKELELICINANQVKELEKFVELAELKDEIGRTSIYQADLLISKDSFSQEICKVVDSLINKFNSWQRIAGRARINEEKEDALKYEGKAEGYRNALDIIFNAIGLDENQPRIRYYSIDYYQVKEKKNNGEQNS